ncbi:LOW QUALITY PROTEIN: vacuolar protein sorting-associated protein 16 homolog [Ixodes scapularis]|uniref:LOW QUALITY PROTEIN: vacuolar protein sorting-associated protein 16 homolog n=1 Tax=Ixodes scapularis TaxID=6945 RepID=UPI001A9F9F0A|nr:LOW QUALITY PROTEIN: vacuolar protein sorting-associated protein 16 homolog [Ixodes scapularis]
MALYTADWSPLGRDVYYRKFELYSMKWQEQGLNLSEFIVAAAPYGGPIAIIRDEKKIMKIKLSSVCLIHLFSASGQTLGNIRHDSGIIVAMGWSNTESLVCVQKDGVIIEYNLLGKILETFTMGQVPKDTNVLDCKIFTTSQRTGVGVLTGSYSFFLVESISSHKTWQLPEVPGMVAPPSSWTIIADEQGTRVVVAKDDKIFVLDPRGSARCIEETPPITTMFKAVTEMAVSFDYRNIALFLDDGHLWIGTSDLRSTLCELDTKEKSRPKQLLWCGQKAVVGHWGKILLVLGFERDFINYPVDVPIHLVQEVDGVRLIGNTIHELLQKVPNVVKDVFRIGSMDPGALLLAASVEFEKKSYKADEYLRSIIEENNLELAIQQCIDAAAHEYQSATQKKLLRAACFGKSFIPSMNPDGFVNACRTLRVLNAVREHTVGLPLTYVQLQCLTMEVLLDRLILRQHYYLALKIAKFLRIPDTEGTSRILAHWACYKVAQMHVPTDEVARAISQKLESSPGILYSEIARKAVQCGRRDLAVKLLDCEPRASEQVPILIELGKEEHALVKAIDSGDTDLIYTVMLKLKEMKSSDFDLTIRQYPVALALYLKLCKEWDLQKLEALYDVGDNFTGVAECKIMESYRTPRVEQRLALLQAAATKYRQAKNDFCATQTEDQLRLMKHQLKYEGRFNDKFDGLSVQQTMRRLMEIKEMKLAEDLCKEFKVPEKRFWWLKLSVLAEGNQWIELEKFSKSKKSPIGYEPFIDICLKYDNKYEAMKYLAKAKEENKVKYFVKLGNLDEAAKFAFEQKDENALNFILSKCTAANRAISEKISTMKQQLGGKR